MWPTGGYNPTDALTANITETALKQTKDLNEKYKDAKFFGLPIRGNCGWDIYAPNSCKFHTYDPQLLASVSCVDGVTCKLTHTVSTIKSYTSPEGHNWGAKFSTKLGLFDKIFEVGGEVADGSTYTCSFTESKTTTDTVECAVGTDNGDKTLQLYNVQSDMECQFSTVWMEHELRDGRFKTVRDRFLTHKEIETIRLDAILYNNGVDFLFAMLPNLDKMSSQVFEKLKNKFPLWNPYTDIIKVMSENEQYIEFLIEFYKEGRISPGPKRVIPFTNENGDSIFQYACTLN